MSHQVILAETVALEALGAWRHVSPAKRSGSEFRMATLEQRQAMMQRHKLFLLWMCVIYKALVIPRRLACWVPWVVTQNVSLELWLRIGVKHVAFLELWLRMVSLELWLGMTMNIRNSWVVARVGECCQCECACCATYDGSR